MKKWYRAPFWEKHLKNNNLWLKKLIVVLIGIFLVLIPFFIFWGMYHDKPEYWTDSNNPIIYVCYNDCPLTFAGELRIFFRTHAMMFWILASSFLLITVIGFCFVFVDNRVLLFSIVVFLVSVLTNFINWVSDSRGALDYWIVPNYLNPGYFFGIGNLIRKMRMDASTVTNWPDWCTWISSDTLLISGIYCFVKYCIKRHKTKKTAVYCNII